MDKIVINGTFDENRIKEIYSNTDVEIFFNISCSNLKICNDYSAVFFVGDYNEDELKKWIGNEHLRISKNEEDLFKEINFFLGIPKPIEIERKFLIERPSDEVLKNLDFCSFVDISQCYINKENERYRVRKRGKDGEYIYIKTQKIKISEIRRIEIEERISKEEYENAIKGEKVLSKTRYLIVYQNKYFELDVFPFWKDKALLEIELKDEREEFSFPQFVNVIEEVSNDKEYRNSIIAQKHGIVLSNI